jgi:hypothetical protein
MNQIKLILIYFKKNSIQIILDIIFFLITRGVRASLHAPRLITGPTEHPASTIGK